MGRSSFSSEPSLPGLTRGSPGTLEISLSQPHPPHSPENILYIHLSTHPQTARPSRLRRSPRRLHPPTIALRDAIHHPPHSTTTSAHRQNQPTEAFYKQYRRLRKSLPKVGPKRLLSMSLNGIHKSTTKNTDGACGNRKKSATVNSIRQKSTHFVRSPGRQAIHTLSSLHLPRQHFYTRHLGSFSCHLPSSSQVATYSRNSDFLLHR